MVMRKIKIKNLIKILKKISNKEKLNVKFIDDKNLNSPRRRVPYINKINMKIINLLRYMKGVKLHTIGI